MTPYEIEVMLWYSSRCLDHEHIHDNPPIWRPTITKFLASDLLRRGDPDKDADCCYKITDKGRAYVEHLCAMPLPVCKWVQPC